jgi:hypothetical protein
MNITTRSIEGYGYNLIRSNRSTHYNMTQDSDAVNRYDTADQFSRNIT